MEPKLDLSQERPSTQGKDQTAFSPIVPAFSNLTSNLPTLPPIPDGPATFAVESPLPLPPKKSEDDIGPPPDGGVTAWLCVLGAFLAVFCIFGFNTSVGQLQAYYLENQLKDYSPSSVGWISSIALFVVSSGSIFSGRYFDSHGTTLLCVSGATLSIVALIAIALSQEYYQFLLAHACLGVAGTLIYAPAQAVSGQWFNKKRGTAVGFVVAGSGLGGVIYPIMIKRLIEQLGFRNGMLTVAAMNAGLMVICCCTMKARLPPRQPAPWRDLLRPWSSPRYTCLAIGCSMVLMNWASPYFNATVYARTNTVSPRISGYSIAILQSGSFVGRIISGMLGDRFGPWTVYTAMGTLSSLVLLSLWTPTSLPDGVVILGLCGYGFVSGAWMSLIAATCASISPMKEYGMRLGMLWTMSGLPALAGPVICGALVTAGDGKFTYAAIFSGSTIFSGVMVAISPILFRGLADHVLTRRDSLAKSEEAGMISPPGLEEK